MAINIELDPEFPSIPLWQRGRRMFEAYAPENFTSDASFRKFARNTLYLLGSHNVVESHAQLYNSLMLPELEVSKADFEYGCPEAIRTIGTDALGLCWLDHVAVAEYFPGQSHFTDIANTGALQRPVLCDPYYGLAIFPYQDRWKHASFTLDWMKSRSTVIGDKISHYTNEPSKILKDGADTALFFWGHLIDKSSRENLRYGKPAEVVIRSFSELQDFATSLQSALSITEGNSRVWFRGQNAEHLMLDRQQAVEAGYLPYANIRDPSLVPSLYRNPKIFGGDRAMYHKTLVDLMAWEMAAEDIFGPDFVDVPLGAPFPEEQFPSGMELVSHQILHDQNGVVRGGRTRYTTFQKSAWQRGLLLQHYGCPTPFIDVTSSIDIAHWFATHKFQGNDSDELFSEYQWSSMSSDEWPAIYCFILCPDFQPIIDSSRLNEGATSLRATRQNCGLLGGGGLLARNYAARYVGLKIRLHPDLAKQSKLNVDDLFPGQDEDPVYRELKKYESLCDRNQFPLYGV